MPVEIVVDGIAAHTVYTHRRAVGALLADVGLLPTPANDVEDAEAAGRQALAPPEETTLPQRHLWAAAADGEIRIPPREGLRLSHSLDARIEDGLRISVGRPQPFRITADGRETLISSWAATPAELLKDAEIPFASHDQVFINGVPGRWHETLSAESARLNAPLFDAGRPWAQTERDPLRIEVNRPTLLIVDEGAMPYTIHTMAETVGEALRGADITIYLGDDVQPSLGTPVNAGMKVLIQRSTPVTLLADGRLYKTRTLSRTVADALAEIGVGLTGLDEVSPPLDAQLYPDMQITIARVLEEIDLEEEIAPYESIVEWDPNLLIDTEVVRPGANGITRWRYRIRHVDGQEVARTLEDVWVAQEPRQEVIVYGQKIVPQTLVNDAGQEFTYWRKIRMRATSYSAATAGVSPAEPWYGRTRTGDPMRKGIVAVDPRYIPLRSRVYVPGYGFGDALDTGGNIRYRRIDLGYDDDNLELWSQWVDVYLLWPPPPAHQIVWRLTDLPEER